jgi:hypothetical protein
MKAKALSLAYMSLFAMVVACTPQPSMVTTRTAPPSAPTPASYAAGSAANTTTAFDGTYNPASVQNISQGNALAGAGGGGANTANCPNYTASPLVISNGLAEFQVLYLRFQGYVTPQGSLEMSSGQGQHFSGQINPQGVITGRATGACAYNVSWQKSA